MDILIYCRSCWTVLEAESFMVALERLTSKLLYKFCQESVNACQGVGNTC